MTGQDTIIIRSQGWEFCRTDNDNYHNDYNTVYWKCYWVSVMHERQNHHSWIKTELAKRKLQLLWFLHGRRPAFLIHKLSASIMNGGEARALGKEGGEGNLTRPVLWGAKEFFVCTRTWQGLGSSFWVSTWQHLELPWRQTIELVCEWISRLG